uniref:Uncharacterized protein n=1 Tax=Vitis vinifera TaxID=29760 RepID=A5BND8_VITVI|nr:hypothetical protein VITISV_015743 [Vitis vinifera]
MYILNDGIDMRTKFAAMERRLEKLEMTNMQPVQAISQTPLQAMPCAICLSYEHLGEECPTIPVVREMFGDCNTYNSNWRDHPNFSWKPQPPQYQQPAQAPQQASNLEQAMMNLNKVMEDFVEAKKSINAQLSQRIDSVESSLNKKMDEVQNDLSQKIDNLQDSISSIHEMEAQEGESSMVKEIEEVITLRSGKEVDLPACKLEHKGKLHFAEDFSAAKPLFGTRVPFRSTVTLISQLRNGCEITKRKNSQFRSQSSISQGILRLRNHFLAHECHLEAPCEINFGLRNHFGATKWLRNDLQALKWLRNHLQASKWPSNCEIDLRNGGRCLGIKIHSQKSGVKSEELVVERSLKLDALNLNWLGVIDGPPLHGQFRKEYL